MLILGIHLAKVSQNKGSTSGFLEILENGEWRSVTYEKWSWNATMVACKMLGFGYTTVYLQVLEVTLLEHMPGIHYLR